MQSQEILEKYLKFYVDRGHSLVPNMSLVPEGDSTLLFVNSGMFPLVPYLSGEPHPLGTRLVNVQRAVRFEDLEEIGDATHTIAFHMIGNWSLGDYFKSDQLPWAYQFIIEELKLDPKKLFATVFEGDEFAPRDDESISIIKSIFSKYGIDARENERIFAYGRGDNWWKRGDAVGELGGPDSEIFYYIGDGYPEVGMSPSEHQDLFLEIGNSVFMQYKKTESGWDELPQKNVDFGGGLERLALAVQGKKDIYETDNFWPIIEKIEALTLKKYYSDDTTKRGMRILADHMRSAVFLAMDGVIPSNKDQGYVLRRLLRRMFRMGNILEAKSGLSVSLVSCVVDTFSWLYPVLKEKRTSIEQMFNDEEVKFGKTLRAGYANFKKHENEILSSVRSTDFVKISDLAFDMFQSNGYPFEIFVEDLKVLVPSVDSSFESELKANFDAKFSSHQKQSQTGAEQKFKGGLADQSDTVVRYHTATHLLQYALRKVLGPQVVQKGSNITAERLRFDFPNDSKLTEAQINEITNLINDAVQKALPVEFVILPKEEAIRLGALYMVNESYPDTVKVYIIGSSPDSAISKEFCGGPHVRNTKEIGVLELYKQESIGNGLFRVYARFK